MLRSIARSIQCAMIRGRRSSADQIKPLQSISDDEDCLPRSSSRSRPQEMLRQSLSCDSLRDRDRCNRRENPWCKHPIGTHERSSGFNPKTDGKGEFEITAAQGEYVLQTVARGFITDKLPAHLSATTPATHIVLQIAIEGCVHASLPNLPVETLDASLSATLPLTPMPPFKQASRKPHPPGK